MKHVLGVISILLIVFGAIESYFSFEKGTGLMCLGIIIAALIVFINKGKNKNE